MRHIISVIIPKKLPLQLPYTPIVEHIANLDVIETIQEHKVPLSKILQQTSIGLKLLHMKCIPTELEEEFVFEKLYEKLEEFTIGKLRQVLSPILKEVKVVLEKFKVYEPFSKTLNLRSYYCIVKGDADSMGELLFGKLGISIYEYVKKIIEYLEVNITEKEIYNKLARYVDELIDILHEVLGIEKLQS